MAGMQKEQGSSHPWQGCLCTKSQCLRLLWLGEVRAGAGGDRLIKFIKVPQSPKVSSCFNPPTHTLPKWWRRSKDTNPPVNPVVWGMGTSVGCCCQKQTAWRSGFARNKFFICVLLHKKEKSMLLKLSASWALLRIKGWWAVCLQRLWQTLKLWEYLNTAVETEFGRLRSGGLSSLSWVWCSEWSSLPERIRNSF